MLLWRGLKKEGAWRRQKHWLRFLLQLGVANGALVAIIIWLKSPVDAWFTMTGLQRTQEMTVLVASGVAVYFVMLVASGIRLRHFRLN